MPTAQVPDSARVVIIGGGIIGCSIAYHLGHLGWSDVVLVERDQLTSGTTWHAAGLMTTFGSTSETSVEMRMYTRDLYGRLEAETGLCTGFEALGFIELAADSDRVEEYRRVAAFNRMCGNNVEEISPSEIKKLFPLARVDDIEAGFYLQQDGRVNPVDATMALAKGARQYGVKIVEGVSVTNVTTENDRVTGRTRVGARDARKHEHVERGKVLLRRRRGGEDQGQREQSGKTANPRQHDHPPEVRRRWVPRQRERRSGRLKWSERAPQS